MPTIKQSLPLRSHDLQTTPKVAFLHAKVNGFLISYPSACTEFSIEIRKRRKAYFIVCVRPTIERILPHFSKLCENPTVSIRMGYTFNGRFVPMVTRHIP